MKLLCSQKQVSWNWKSIFVLNPFFKMLSFCALKTQAQTFYAPHWHSKTFWTLKTFDADSDITQKWIKHLTCLKKLWTPQKGILGKMTHWLWMEWKAHENPITPVLSVWLQLVVCPLPQSNNMPSCQTPDYCPHQRWHYEKEMNSGRKCQMRKDLCGFKRSIRERLDISFNIILVELITTISEKAINKCIYFKYSCHY